MKFIDLYAGIGGFRYALEDLGHECVFSSEINNDAIGVYSSNFKDDIHSPFFDLNIVSELSKDEMNKLIPDHDILCAGFPCQPFSVGGKKLGFEDARGNQFFNILKILEAKKPRFIFLENVKNIISHDNGNTYKVIREELKKIGYEIQEEPFLLSPVDIGIPQMRDRAFFFAEYNNRVINIQKNTTIKTKEIKFDTIKNAKKHIIDDYFVKTIEAWQEFAKNVKMINNRKIPDIWLDEMLEENAIKKEFPNWKIKAINDMKILYQKNKDFIDIWIKKYDVMNFKRRERKFEWRSGNEEPIFKDKIIILRTSGIRIMKGKIFPTLVAMAQPPIIFDERLNNFREITIKEAAWLQSFPVNMNMNNNYKKQLKLFGNAVNVDVVRYIAKKILK